MGLREAFDGARRRLDRPSRADREEGGAFAGGLARRWRALAAGIVCLVVIGSVGFAIGRSQVTDAESARQTGIVAGEQRGAEIGKHDGYVQAFKPARERAYRLAYRAAYRKAYAEAFAEADLSTPRNIVVSGP